LANPGAQLSIIIVDVQTSDAARENAEPRSLLRVLIEEAQADFLPFIPETEPCTFFAACLILDA
jgi:hypothetical protein